jgi:hypothetical protein
MSHRALHPEFAHIIDPLSSVTSWLIVAFMILTPLISFYFIRQEQFLIFISNHQTGNQSVIQLHIFIQYIFQHHNMSSTLANGMRPRTRLSLSRDISNTNAGNAEVPRRRKNALVSGFKSDRSWIKRETGTQFFDFWGRAVGDTIGWISQGWMIPWSLIICEYHLNQSVVLQFRFEKWFLNLGPGHSTSRLSAVHGWWIGWINRNRCSQPYRLSNLSSMLDLFSLLSLSLLHEWITARSFQPGRTRRQE